MPRMPVMVARNNKNVSRDPKDDDGGGDSPESSAFSPLSLPEINDSNRADPLTYARISDAIANAMNKGMIEPLAAKRQIEVMSGLCEQNAGMSIADASRLKMDPVARLTDVFSLCESELVELEQSFGEVDLLRATDERLKKKWREIIARVRSLHQQSLSDHAKGMIYVMRDGDESRAGMVLHLKWFHVKLFDIWEDQNHKNDLVMMHPGSGKTTCSRWQKCVEIGEMPQLRMLLIYDTIDKAKQEAKTIKTIMNHGRYHALYPGIRILGRAEGEENSSLRFTVTRPNFMVREPTMEVGGILCNFNGQGYGRLWLDDPTPADAREHQHIRTKVKNTFHRVLKRRLRDMSISRISMVCTPWHDEDLAGEIRFRVGQGKLPTWRVFIDEFAIRDDAQGRPIPLWPEKYSAEYLEEARFEDPSMYACCFELRARTETARPVKKLWFYNSTDIRCGTDADKQNDDQVHAAMKDAEWWLSLDPAGASGATNSDTGAVEIALLYNKFALCTDVWFHQKQPPEMLDWVIERIVTRWRMGQPYRGVMIEAQGGIKGMVTMWGDLLPKRLEAEGMPLSVRPALIAPGTRVGTLTINRSKMRRLEEASPYINSGIFRFAGRRDDIRMERMGASHSNLVIIPGSSMDKLRNHILNFDGSNRFDAGDAVTQWILVNKSRLADFAALRNVAKPKEEEAAVQPRSTLAEMWRKQHSEAAEREKQLRTADDDIAAMMTKYSLPSQRNVA